MMAADGASRPLLRLGPPLRVRSRRRRLSRGRLPAVAAARVGLAGTGPMSPMSPGTAAAREHHEGGRLHHVGRISRCVAEVDGVGLVMLMLVVGVEMGMLMLLLLLLTEPREEPVVSGLVDLCDPFQRTFC